MNVKNREDVKAIMEKIATPGAGVGIDPVYVHALILDKLSEIERRLAALESTAAGAPPPAARE